MLQKVSTFPPPLSVTIYFAGMLIWSGVFLLYSTAIVPFQVLKFGSSIFILSCTLWTKQFIPRADLCLELRWSLQHRPYNLLRLQRWHFLHGSFTIACSTFHFIQIRDVITCWLFWHSLKQFSNFSLVFMMTKEVTLTKSNWCFYDKCGNQPDFSST